MDFLREASNWYAEEFVIRTNHPSVSPRIDVSDFNSDLLAFEDRHATLLSVFGPFYLLLQLLGAALL